MLVGQPTPVDFYLRPASEDDKAYILATWLKQYKSAAWARRMPPDIFYPFHRRVVEDLLHTVPCMVLANTTAPVHIVGYMCGEYYPEALLIHFAYIKHPLRRRGMARYMAEALGPKGTPIFATHWTGVLTKLPWVVYNPYLLFQPYRSRSHECQGPNYGRLLTFGEWARARQVERPADAGDETFERDDPRAGEDPREDSAREREPQEAPAEEGEVSLGGEGVEAEGGAGPEPE